MLTKNTDFNLIPVFVAIYEELSLSKAAVRLGVSQPAISKSLLRLREIYGEALFNRHNYGIEPTNFSMDIYPFMLSALKSFNSTILSSSHFSPNKTERVFRLACISAASYTIIPELFRQFPNIRLEVHSLLPEDYEQALRLQHYDAIISISSNKRTILKSELIFSEFLNVVCYKNHSRINGTCTKQQFLEEEHVVLSKGKGKRSLLEDENIKELAERKIIYWAPGIVEMLPIIQNSEAIALMPKSFINKHSKIYNIKSSPIPFEHKTFEIFAYWHPNRSSEPAIQWLLSQLKKVGRKVTKQCIYQ